MCFSATASFVAGGALGAVGGVTMAEVKIKAEMPLASIPLIFGIQQTIEGVIWVSFGSGLISSHRILNIFAIGALISFFIANWLFNMTFISVWCFFAAVLSVLIYWHFKRTSVAGRQVEAG